MFIFSFLGKLKICIWFINQNFNSSIVIVHFFGRLIVLNISIRLVRRNDHFHEADKVDQALHCFFWSFFIELSTTSFRSKLVFKNLFFSLVFHHWSSTVHALPLTTFRSKPCIIVRHLVFALKCAKMSWTLNMWIHLKNVLI